MPNKLRITLVLQLPQMWKSVGAVSAAEQPKPQICVGSYVTPS